MINKRKKNRVKKQAKVYICIAILLFTIFPISNRTKAETSQRDKIIVSMGDSYSSGEGIEPFYGQEEALLNRLNNPDWLAHRSQKSWSSMLTLLSVNGTMVDHRGTNWYFVASSGAETKHIQNKQKKEYDRDGYSAYKDAAPRLDPQINIFNELGDKKADYVTLTLGGNDADFVGIIKDAAMGCTYFDNRLVDKINYTWSEFYKKGGIRDNLRQAYEDIASAAGSQATIIVAGYPPLLDPYVFVPFNPEEAIIINDAVSHFNDAIEKIVLDSRNSNINICFVSVEEAFDGHEAYSKDPYINKIVFFQPEDLKKNILASPMNAISDYSIHPNEKGARAYADCVQEKIDELEGNIGQPSEGTDCSMSIEEQKRLYAPIIDEYREILLSEEPEYSGDELVYYEQSCKNEMAMAGPYRRDYNYGYYDLDGDGILELFIGEAMYTIKDETVVGIYYGWCRNSYEAYDNAMILQHGSSGAADNTINIYKFENYELNCIASFRLIDDSIYYSTEEIDYDITGKDVEFVTQDFVDEKIKEFTGNLIQFECFSLFDKNELSLYMGRSIAEIPSIFSDVYDEGCTSGFGYANENLVFEANGDSSSPIIYIDISSGCDYTLGCDYMFYGIHLGDNYEDAIRIMEKYGTEIEEFDTGKQFELPRHKTLAIWSLDGKTVDGMTMWEVDSW